MSDKIVYSVNRSSVANIAAHIMHADTTFEPCISSRINISVYAHKLHDRAVRFEAWLDEELVGLVASYCNQPAGCEAFVTSVSVWPEWQRKGIANQLMRQCIEHVQSLGFVQIELKVNEHSLPAIALYHKLGFNTLRSSDSTLTMGMKFGRQAK